MGTRFTGDATRRVVASETERHGSARSGAGQRSTGARRSADPSSIPAGSVKVVTEWVGSDVDRAQAALDAEHAAESPRKTLIAALDRVVSAAASG